VLSAGAGSDEGSEGHVNVNVNDKGTLQGLDEAQTRVVQVGGDVKKVPL
jgi:hypothetical protein